MAPTSAAQCRPLVEELSTLLHQIDPDQLREEMASEVNARFRQMKEQSSRFLERVEDLPEGSVQASLRARVRDLSALLHKQQLSEEASFGKAAERWAEFHRAALPLYEQLVRGLEELDATSSRPRRANYIRNAYHAVSNLGVLALVLFLLDAQGMILVAGAFTALGWTLEFTRRRIPFVQSFCLWLFAKVMHPHEEEQVNSATWLVSGLFLLALIGDKPSIALAIVVLALGDPAAAVIGRRFGRTPLRDHRTLEGSLAFVFTAFIAQYLLIVTMFPEISGIWALATAGGGAVAGASAELFSGRLDDNFSVPVSVLLATMAVRFFMP